MQINKSTLPKLFEKLTADDRINAWHISLYAAILICWIKSGHKPLFRITRAKLMAIAHIKSFMTYHKCLGQLQSLGYIVYVPSYDSYTGSAIQLLG